MNTGYDLNNPNKYMQTAFDAFKSNQPATQQAVSQGPQAGLRYLAGLQAQANQQQAQQAQPQALPSTTVLQQLLQKLGQNHGIMAQLPASIDIASAPTQPAMATGGLVSLAAGGPIAFSGGGDVPEFDPEKYIETPEFDPKVYGRNLDELSLEELAKLSDSDVPKPKAQVVESIQSVPESRSSAPEPRVSTQSASQSTAPSTPDGPKVSTLYKTEDELARARKNVEARVAKARLDDAAWKRHLQHDTGKAQYEQYVQQRNKAQEDKALESIRQRTNRDIRRTFTAPDVANKLEYLTAPPPPRPYEVGPSMPTDYGQDVPSWNEPPKTSGTGEGIFSRAGKAIAEHPITKGIGKIGRHLGAAGFVLDPQMWDATKAPMIIAKAATGTPLSESEVESLTPGKSIADPMRRAANLTGSYTERGLEYLYDNAGRYLNWHDTDRPETATPFVGPLKPTESPVHEPVAKAEPIAAAKEGVKAVSATEHAKKIEKRAEAPKGKEPQGAVPEEKQYTFDQSKEAYENGYRPDEQTVSQPTDRAYAPAPEASGIASVTPEEMIQHLQRLGGGGYQEDPEVLQMRNEQLESAKANKWANSIAGLIGGIYGGHSPYASENVARGIMTALGQYQAGTQAEDAIRSGIMGSKEAAQKSQASYQQHLLDKFIEAQLAKGRDQADLRRAMLAGEAQIGAAKTRADATRQAAWQRHNDAVARTIQGLSMADQKLAVETTKAALKAVDDYVKNYSRGIPSEDDKKRVFLTVWHTLAPNIPITDEAVAGMTGSPPPTGSPGNPTATYGSSSNQISDEDED